MTLDVDITNKSMIMSLSAMTSSDTCKYVNIVAYANILVMPIDHGSVPLQNFVNCN